MMLTPLSVSAAQTDTSNSETSEETQVLAQTLVAVVSSSSSSSLSTTSGKCGTSVKWKLSSKGVLTIYGSGDMADYDPDNESYAPWAEDYEVQEYVTSIVVKSGVTSIGDYAFAYLWNVTSVSIADTVTSIGSHAFSLCYGITSITIPASVKTIHAYAFSSVASLTSIKLQKGLKTIGDGAFYECVSITSITIPSNVTKIGDAVFANCESLKKITVKSGNIKYKSVDGILYNKSGKTLIVYPANKSGSSFKISSGVTTIAYAAFYANQKLTKVTVPKSVTKVSKKAFAGSGISTIVFNGDAPTFGKKIFSSVEGLTVKYKAGNTTWTSSVMKDYGGTDVTWKYFGTGLSKPTIKSLTSSAAGKIKITLKSADENAIGYQYVIATNKSFTKGKKSYKTSSLSKTITGLTAGKTYYVKVRSYRKINGKVYYGDYSSVQKITVAEE